MLSLKPVDFIAMNKLSRGSGGGKGGGEQGFKEYTHLEPDQVFFIPFSAASHAAKYYPDEYPVYGDAFRVLVLDVRGKTVVVYIENVALPPAQFPAFLTKAEQILRSLRFPTSAKGA